MNMLYFEVRLVFISYMFCFFEQLDPAEDQTQSQMLGDGCDAAVISCDCLIPNLSFSFLFSFTYSFA